MGKKTKPFSTHSEAINKLIAEVPAGTVRYYEVPSFPTDLFPADYTNKCSHFSVATSGAAESGLDWMVICPHRVDEKDKAVDLDPAIIVLNSASLEPAPSGLIGYHQNYSGRTSVLTGAYDWHDMATTMAQLRSKILAGSEALANAPHSVINSLHHMAKKFQEHPDCTGPARPRGSAETEGKAPQHESPGEPS